MKYFLLIVVVLWSFTPLFGQNNFRTRQDGAWTDPDTWEEFSGSWSNTSNIPDSSSGNIVIRSFNLVTLASEVVADQVVIDEDGALTVHDGGYLIITDGTGDDLTITVGDGMFTFDGFTEVEAGGIIENRGSIISSATNFSIAGEFIHNQNGGVIPDGGWIAPSVLTINGIIDQAPGGLDASFYDLNWDNPGMTSAVSLTNNISSIGNDLHFISTNGQMLNLNTGSTLNLLIGNDLTIDTEAVIQVTSGGNVSLTVNGNSSISGELHLSDGTGNPELIVAGDLAVDGLLTGPGNLTISGAYAHTVAITGSLSGTINYSLNNNSEVILGESILNGPGSFTTGSDVTLHISSTDPAGAIQASMSGGNIQTDPALRTYGDGLTLIYEGVDKQYVEDLPGATGLTVTVLNMAGVELLNDLIIKGDLTLTSGNLILASHQLTLESMVDATSGFYVIPDPEATLIVNGTGNFGKLPVNGEEIGMLQINRTGLVKLASNLRVVGELSLLEGELALDGFTLELQGDVSAVNGMISTTSGSGISISGEGTFSGLPLKAGSNQLAILKLDREDLVWAPNEMLTISSEVHLLRGAFDNTGNHLKLKNGSTIYRSAEGSLMNNPPIIVSGTYNVAYQGGDLTSGAELIGSSTPDVLGKLTVETGNITIDKELIIKNSLVVNGGSLVMDGFDLKFRGNELKTNGGALTLVNNNLSIENFLTIQGDDMMQLDQIIMDPFMYIEMENLKISGSINGNIGCALSATGPIEFNGANDQQLSVENMSFKNMVLDKASGSVELSGTTELYGWLLFEQPATVITNDQLSLLSDPGDPYQGGSIGAIPDGGMVTGEVTVEWYNNTYDPAGLAMDLASPIVDATVADLQDDFQISGTFAGSDPVSPDPSLYFYDETVAGDITQGWIAYPQTDNQALLTPGTGYHAIVFKSSPFKVDVTGSINQGGIAIPVTYTDNGTSATDGWNLVANPYPAAISWDNVTGWDKQIVNNVIAINENGVYKYWNGTGAGSGTDLIIEDGRLAKGQAFWIQASATGNLLINENAKADKESVPVNTSNQLILSLEKGAEKDQALIAFSSQATAGYDTGLDAVKLNNTGFDLATLADDGTPLAMNFLNNPGCSGVIGVSLGDVLTGSYIMRLSILQTLDIPYTIEVVDHYMDQSIDISQQNIYLFNVDTSMPESLDNSRFTIEFTTDVDKIIDKTIAVNTAAEICSSENTTVILPSSQNWVNYQLELNGNAYGDIVAGNGSSIFIDIPVGDLQATNQLKVIAAVAYCDDTVYLDSDITIDKIDLTPEIVYAGGKLVSNYLNGNTWYLGDDETPVSTENELMPQTEGIYTLEVTQGSCTADTSYEFTITANDDELEGWAIYPNPATNVLFISHTAISQPTRLELLSITGKQILSQELDAAQGIDVSGIPEGVYILRLITGDQGLTKRVIIKR